MDPMGPHGKTGQDCVPVEATLVRTMGTVQSLVPEELGEDGNLSHSPGSLGTVVDFLQRNHVGVERP